jgi:hypothetical protein
MHVLSANQIEAVSGSGFTEAAGAFGAALALGTASFGSGWGLVGVGVAFGVAPFAVVAMGGLALYAGWELMC